MFKLKKEQKPTISQEEEARLKSAILGEQQQTSGVQQMITQKSKIVSKTPSQYFISKKEFVKDKKTITTNTGQIIELPEEITKTVVKEIHTLTKEDLIAIIKGIDENKPIHQLALKMLTDEL